MIEITGLWEKKDKNGNTYFSGTMGNAKVLVMKNNFKEKETQPDYKMFLVEKEKKEEKKEEKKSSW